MAGFGNFIPSQFHQEKSSLEAAAEAAAKVNAMLIAKGKLRPNQIHNNSQNQKKVNPSNMVAAEVEINDAPLSMRNMLTRGPTQEEITKFSGAAVSTRGRYMTPVERMKNTGSERPLYLFVQGPSQDSVNVAVARINEILTGGKGAAATGGGLVRTSAIGPPVPHHQPQLNLPPPHQPPPMNHPPPGGLLPLPTLEMPPVHQPPPMLAAPMQPPPEMHQITVLEEKLFIGLEHAPPNFDVKGKLMGPGGSYLMHIESETGAKVMLRGKGSGFIDPALGREPLEPMHVVIQHPSVLAMQQAKQLAENLIQTVQQMYASFQQALAALPPPVLPGPTAFISGLQQPTSLAEVALMGPPPGLPTITAMPEAQLVANAPALQPQQTMIVPSSSMSSVMVPAGSLASSLPVINPATGQHGAPSVLLNTTLSMAPVPVVTTLPISSQPPLQLQPPLPTALELGQQQLIMSQAPPPQPLQMTLAPQMSVQTSLPASMASMASHLAPAPGGLAHHHPAALQPPTMQLVSQPTPVAPPPMLAAPPVPVSVPTQQQIVYAPPPEVVSSGPMQPQQGLMMSSTAPSSHIYSLATSSSMVSHTPLGPSKDAVHETHHATRRRFTEDKDDKIPDSLLGYQHGPPHLVNLVCSSSPPPGSQPQPVLHPAPPTLMAAQTPSGQPPAVFQHAPHPHQHPHPHLVAPAPQHQPIAVLPAQPQPGVPAGQMELQPAHPGLPAAMAPGHPVSFAMPQAIQVQAIHTVPAHAQLPPPPNSLSPVSQAYHVPPSSLPAEENRFGVPVTSSAGSMMPPPPPPGALGMAPSAAEQGNGPRPLMPPPSRHEAQPWGGPAHGGMKRGMPTEEGEQDRKRRKENGLEEEDNSGQSPSNQSDSPKPGTPTQQQNQQGGAPRSQNNHSPPGREERGPPPLRQQDSPPHLPPPPPPPHFHPHAQFPQHHQSPHGGQMEGLPPQQIIQHPGGGPHLNGQPPQPFDPAVGGQPQPPPPPMHQQFLEHGGAPQPPPPPGMQFQEFAPPPPNSQAEFHHIPHQGQGEMAGAPHPYPPPPGHPQGGELAPHPFTHTGQGEMAQPQSHHYPPFSQSYSLPGPQAHFISTSMPASSSTTFLPAPHFIPQSAPGGVRAHLHGGGPPPPPPPPPPTSQYQHGPTPPQGYWA